MKAPALLFLTLLCVLHFEGSHGVPYCTSNVIETSISKPVAWPGQSVTLSCYVSSPAAEHISWVNPDNVPVSSGGALLGNADPRLSIHGDNSHPSCVVYNLTISDLTLEDAGTYTCRPMSMYRPSSSVEVAFGYLPNASYPLCSISGKSTEVKAGSKVSYTCTTQTTYPAWDLQWLSTLNGTSTVSTSTLILGSGTETSIATSIRATSDVNGTVFTCFARCTDSGCLNTDVRNCSIGPLVVLPASSTPNVAAIMTHLMYLNSTTEPPVTTANTSSNATDFPVNTTNPTSPTTTIAPPNITEPLLLNVTGNTPLPTTTHAPLNTAQTSPYTPHVSPNMTNAQENTTGSPPNSTADVTPPLLLQALQANSSSNTTSLNTTSSNTTSLNTTTDPPVTMPDSSPNMTNSQGNTTSSPPNSTTEYVTGSVTQPLLLQANSSSNTSLNTTAEPPVTTPENSPNTTSSFSNVTNTHGHTTISPSNSTTEYTNAGVTPPLLLQALQTNSSSNTTSSNTTSFNTTTEPPITTPENSPNTTTGFPNATIAYGNDTHSVSNTTNYVPANMTAVMFLNSTADPPLNATETPANATATPSFTTALPSFNTTDMSGNTTTESSNSTFNVPYNMTAVMFLNSTGNSTNATAIPPTNTTDGVSFNTTATPSNATGIPPTTTDAPPGVTAHLLVNATGSPTENATAIPVPDTTSNMTMNTSDPFSNTTHTSSNATFGPQNMTVNFLINATATPGFNTTTMPPVNTTAPPVNTTTPSFNATTEGPLNATTDAPFNTTLDPFTGTSTNLTTVPAVTGNITTGNATQTTPQLNATFINGTQPQNPSQPTTSQPTTTRQGGRITFWWEAENPQQPTRPPPPQPTFPPQPSEFPGRPSKYPQRPAATDGAITQQSATEPPGESLIDFLGFPAIIGMAVVGGIMFIIIIVIFACVVSGRKRGRRRDVEGTAAMINGNQLKPIRSAPLKSPQNGAAPNEPTFAAFGKGSSTEDLINIADDPMDEGDLKNMKMKNFSKSHDEGVEMCDGRPLTANDALGNGFERMGMSEAVL